MLSLERLRVPMDPYTFPPFGSGLPPIQHSNTKLHWIVYVSHEKTDNQCRQTANQTNKHASVNQNDYLVIDASTTNPRQLYESHTTRFWRLGCGNCLLNVFERKQTYIEVVVQPPLTHCWCCWWNVHRICWRRCVEVEIVDEIVDVLVGDVVEVEQSLNRQSICN